MEGTLPGASRPEAALQAPASSSLFARAGLEGAAPFKAGEGEQREVWVPPALPGSTPKPWVAKVHFSCCLGHRWDMQSQSESRANLWGSKVGGLMDGSCKAAPLSLSSSGVLGEWGRRGGAGVTPSRAQGLPQCPAASSQTHRDQAGLLQHHLLQWSLAGLKAQGEGLGLVSGVAGLGGKGLRLGLGLGGLVVLGIFGWGFFFFAVGFLFKQK